MNERQSRKQETVALLRLFQYAREEARSLGLAETARLIDLPATSCLEESIALFGLHVLDETELPDKPEPRVSN